MDTITLSLKIENIYVDEDNDDEITKVTVTLPAPPPNSSGSQTDDEAYREWHETHIRDLTGTGQPKGDAAYFVEVTASSDEALLPVGAEFEYGT